MAERVVSPNAGPISTAFDACDKPAALMPYMMGGFPNVADSLKVGEAYVEAGADLIELGVPFSDPLADGPAIQAAGERALAAGADFESVVGVGHELAQRVPVVLMCYANPLMARGFERAGNELSERGIAGLIVPDLPAREAGELRAACDGAGLDLVPLVAPTTPPGEVEWIAQQARGFVYVVAVTGVTGERSELATELTEVVERVKGATDLPVAVGFGIGTPELAARVAQIADGVIIGSRLVRALLEAGGFEAGLGEARALLADIADALRGGTVD